ncbi:MAG TPA: Xaa-Pro aminopeptidase [Vicinamibacterales bacterium]|nr:Xaa-Pro aminopeptidase [Vicinamibacterales bacterium]
MRRFVPCHWRPSQPAVRAVLAFALAFVAAASAASDLSDDLAARRARLMERLGPDTMLVLLSAPTRVYSGDVDYEYHQDPNLYYLTGITQPDTALVLMPGNTSRREILFIKDRNPEREHWTGRLLSRDDARTRSGIATVLSINAFDPFLGDMLSRRAYGSTVDDKDAATFFAALGEGRAKLAVAMEQAAPGQSPTRVQALLQGLRDRYVGYLAIDAMPALKALRMVKTPYELTMLTTATDISGEGQLAGMRAAAPGIFEYQVKAAIEAVHRGRGALSWAYPSIVGSGPNATILHYPESDRQMQAGELLLVDAAANYAYQASDITRTYPVSGTFSAEQKDIYEVVLRAQEEAIKAARPGATLAGIHNRTVEVLKEGLHKLGLITETSGQQYAMWFTHGTSHFIGIDVHDVGSRNDELRPGMTFTIEPGLYIRQAVLDLLPRTPANLDLIAKVQPAVTKYKDIGVRIEDSFVMEATGARNLSAAVPKTIKEIEAFMRDRRALSGGAR